MFSTFVSLGITEKINFLLLLLIEGTNKDMIREMDFCKETLAWAPVSPVSSLN